MQNSACHEQRNTVPKPWETQGGDSSLPLLMRVWTSGYTSQTSCSPVQTWISDTETPRPYQIAKASLEARRFPLRLKGLWVVFRSSLTLSTFLADGVHRKGCSYYICVIGFRSSKTPPYANHLEQSPLCCEVSVRFICSPSRTYRVVFEPYPRRYQFILRQSNCALLMPQDCVKRSLSCATRRFRKPGRLSVGPS